MRASVFVRPTGLLFFPRTRTSFPHSTTRSRVSFPQKAFFCQAQGGDSGVDGKLSSSVVVSPAVLAAEKDEAKAVLTLFLMKQGLSKVRALRTINRSDAFVDHLVSVHKTRYLVGRELSTLEIREALITYLETLLEEHEGGFVDVVENF